MESFLRVVKPDSVEDHIKEDRLKFFTSEFIIHSAVCSSPHTLTKIWDYFSIYQQKLSSLSLEERNSMVKKYYRDLNIKFQVSGKIYLLLVFLFLGFLLLLLVVVAIAVKEKVSIFCV